MWTLFGYQVRGFLGTLVFQGEWVEKLLTLDQIKVSLHLLFWLLILNALGASGNGLSSGVEWRRWGVRNNRKSFTHFVSELSTQRQLRVQKRVGTFCCF